jgi:hypothetical protein
MNCPQNEEELERVIAALVARKNAAPDNSAGFRMAERQLRGLRYNCPLEATGGIIESLDERWGEYCSPLP